MFRAQFARNPPPEGFVYQPCVYQFSKNNVPALGGLQLATNQETGYIPLQTDEDACFILLAIKIQNSNLNVALWDADGNALMDTYVKPAEYASELPPATELESGTGIEIPAGAVLQVRLQGQ